MKTILALTVCILCLSSCKKKYCWECTSLTRSVGASAKCEVAFDVKYATTSTVCDQREKDIGVIEAMGSHQWATTDNGYTIQHTRTITCAKQ